MLKKSSGGWRSGLGRDINDAKEVGHKVVVRVVDNIVGGDEARGVFKGSKATDDAPNGGTLALRSVDGRVGEDTSDGDELEGVGLVEVAWSECHVSFLKVLASSLKVDG